MIGILLLTLGFVNEPIVQPESCHTTEVNVCYEGYKILRAQFIFWDEYRDGLHVRDWCNVPSATIIPLTQTEIDINNIIAHEDVNQLKQYQDLFEQSKKSGNLPYSPRVIFNGTYPTFNKHTQKYETYLMYRNKPFIIRSKFLKVTCTREDPELDDRKFFDKSLRSEFLPNP